MSIAHRCKHNIYGGVCPICNTPIQIPESINNIRPAKQKGIELTALAMLDRLLVDGDVQIFGLNNGPTLEEAIRVAYKQMVDDEQNALDIFRKLQR